MKVRESDIKRGIGQIFKKKFGKKLGFQGKERSSSDSSFIFFGVFGNSIFNFASTSEK